MTTKNRSKIMDDPLIDKITDVALYINIFSAIIIIISSWFPEGTLLSSIRFKIIYPTQYGGIVDLFFIPSIVLFSVAIYIISEDSLINDWDSMLPTISVIALFLFIGSAVSDTVIPPFSEISLERKIGYFYRNVFSRSIIFLPFFWYKHFNIEARKKYFSFLVLNGLIFLGVNFYFSYKYDDFLKETIYIFGEYASFTLFYIITSVKLMHDIGEEEMKESSDILFHNIIITLMTVNLLSPFVIKFIDTTTGVRLDLFTMIFTVIINSLILLSLKTFSMLYRKNHG